MLLIKNVRQSLRLRDCDILRNLLKLQKHIILHISSATCARSATMISLLLLQLLKIKVRLRLRGLPIQKLFGRVLVGVLQMLLVHFSLSTLL